MQIRLSTESNHVQIIDCALKRGILIEVWLRLGWMCWKQIVRLKHISLVQQFSSSLTVSSTTSRHSEKPKLGVCVLCLCSLQLKVFKSTGWLRYIYSQTQALPRKKLRDRKAKPSFNLHQLKHICLPIGCTDRKRVRQADRRTERAHLFLKKPRIFE